MRKTRLLTEAALEADDRIRAIVGSVGASGQAATQGQIGDEGPAQTLAVRAFSPRAASVVHLIVESDETLRNHLRALLAQLEELIAVAIAEDLGAPENDLRPQVGAASLTAALDVLSVKGGDANQSALTRPLVPLQDAVQTVAGDVAALQALGYKALQKRHFRRERTAGSHPGGRGCESR